MNITYAWTPFFTDTSDSDPPGRLIAGICLHDTETHASVNPRQEGSWHYEIDRDGSILQFVDEADIAWHVRACDRWWPDWLPHWGNYDVSRMNEWAIGIELVSDAAYRAAGEPYTDAQYTALAALIRDLFARRGVLPIVGHGQVQADRSDPVAFDWDAFHRLLAETSEEKDDMAKVQELQAQIDQLNGITKTMQEQIDYKDQLLQQANSRAGVAEAEVERLTDQLANADVRTGQDIASVALTRRDGRVEVLQ
jgi:N-acetyl-anhydromuramyl-L-alanine amidase AmpD